MICSFKRRVKSKQQQTDHQRHSAEFKPGNRRDDEQSMTDEESADAERVGFVVSKAMRHEVIADCGNEQRAGDQNCGGGIEVCQRNRARRNGGQRAEYVFAG